MQRGQCGNPLRVVQRIPFRSRLHKERFFSRLDHRVEGAREILAYDTVDLQRQSKRPGRRLEVCGCPFCLSRSERAQDGDAGQVGDDLLEQLQALTLHLTGCVRQSGQVPAWVGKAGNQLPAEQDR